jgi:glycosyltransferase involved in cell wall biosynthesis
MHRGTDGSSVQGASPRPVGDSPRVLHSLQRWLPLSEQFVHALVTRSRYRAVVVARQALINTDAFPYRPVRSLRLIPTGTGSRRLERRLVTLGLLAAAASYKPALVHHHHGYRAKDPVGLVRRRHLPYVLSLHGEDVTTYVRKWPGELAGVFETVDTFIVPSHFLLDRAVELGVPRDRIVVIPSGVDTGYFLPSPLPDGPPVALFVGRFVEKKGLDVLLAAWPSVQSQVPAATLRVLGYGPLEAMVRSAHGHVEVEEAIPSRRATQVRDAIRRARVVVTPSRTAEDGDSESLLLVNLEAQASGRPVVTTRHGGIPEFVADGSTGLLVPEGDADALGDALVRVLTDDDVGTKLGRNGPQWARQFDVAACTERVDALYDRLIEAAA